MKIWVIGRALPTEQNSFQGSFEFSQAQILAEHGHEVYYFNSAEKRKHQERPFSITKRTIEKVKVITIAVPSIKHVPLHVKARIHRWMKMHLIKTYYKEEGIPEIIHVHYPCPYPYNIFKCYQAQGSRIIATEHWSMVQKRSLKKWLRRNLNDFVQNSDSFICVSNLLREAVYDLTKTKRAIPVIPNALPEMYCCEAIQKISHEGFRFIAVGRLDPIKHYDFLIKVFAKTFGHDNTVSLTIVGSGESEKELHALIRSLNCENNITMTGLMPQDKLKALYESHDVLIVTSKTETFCVPVIEAMACGLPVIITRDVGSAEYISRERGIIIDFDNEAQLSEAMKRIIAEYASYDSDSITDFTNRTFGAEPVYKRILSEYRCGNVDQTVQE